MTAEHRRTRVRLLGTLVAAAILGLTSCTGSGAPQPDRPSADGAAGGAPSAAPSAAVAPAEPDPTPKPSAAARRRPADGDCPSGRWRLQSTAATAGGPVENVSFSGRGAFDLALDDGGWRLIGNQEAPLTATVDIGGFAVSGRASIDGTAGGRYRMIRSAAVFRLERTSGQVDVSFPGGTHTYGMETLAGALVPDGAADLTCHGNSLTIAAENLTLDLRRVRS